MTGGSGRGAGIGQALRVPEFRTLWAAELVGGVLLTPLHAAAPGALLPDVVPGPAFEAALAVRHVTGQAALGGVAAQIWGSRGAIALRGALGMALALAVTGAHLRTPVAGDAPVARPDFVPVEG